MTNLAAIAAVAVTFLSCTIVPTYAVSVNDTMWFQIQSNATSLCLNAAGNAFETCTGTTPIYGYNKFLPELSGVIYSSRSSYPHNCLSLDTSKGLRAAMLKTVKCNKDDPRQQLEISDYGFLQTHNYTFFNGTLFVGPTSVSRDTSSIPLVAYNDTAGMEENATYPYRMRVRYIDYEFSFYYAKATGSPARISPYTCVGNFAEMGVGSSVEAVPCAFSGTPQYKSRLFNDTQVFAYLPKTGQLMERMEIPELCIGDGGCVNLPVEGLPELCVQFCNESDASQKWDVVDGKLKARKSGKCMAISEATIEGYASKMVMTDCSNATTWSTLQMHF